MDIVKINDLLIEVSSENTKLHLENEALKEEVTALRKGLAKARTRRDKYKRKYLKEKWNNKYLSNNWNKLKKLLDKNIRDSKSTSSLNYYFGQVLIQMQEIESGKNE